MNLTETHAYDQDDLEAASGPLCSAQRYLSSRLSSRTISRVNVQTEACITGTEEFFGEVQLFCSTHHRPAPVMTPDFYEGLFERYGILSVQRLEGLPKGGFVGVKLV